MTSSSVTSTKNSAVFDISTEAGTLKVLQAVHRSALDPDTKNQLRDAVFLYRKDKDNDTLTNVCETFASVGIEVSACATPEDPQKENKPIRKLGFSRSKPAFSASRSFSVKAPEPKPETQPVDEKPTPTNPVTAKEAGIAPVDAGRQDEEPLLAKKEVVTKPVVDSDSDSPETNKTALNRISKIKHDINSKVGNPVNLIEKNKELGRAYMNSLLDAMKLSNGGRADELGEAMIKLESNYSEVLSFLESNPVTVEVPETSSDTKQEKPTTPEPEKEVAVDSVAQEVVVPEPVTPKVAPKTEIDPVVPTETKSATPQPAPEPVPEVTKPEPILPKTDSVPTEPVDNKDVKEVVAESVKLNVQSAVPTEPPKFEPVVPPQSPAIKEEAGQPVTPVVNEEIALPKTYQPEETQQASVGIASGGLASVAKAKEVQEMMHNEQVKEVETQELKKRLEEEKMDPIMVSAVTQGLEQLLSEWKLFKSSGLFGTGPSGIEHPLYKKLSSLPMQVVVAGRFEGSTPQIRQSLSDYMNGWRYEEGIVFDYGESFEHYLRRVVHHVLNKK